MATVTIDVTIPPNSPPVANEDAFSVTAGGVVEGNILAQRRRSGRRRAGGGVAARIESGPRRAFDLGRRACLPIGRPPILSARTVSRIAPATESAVSNVATVQIHSDARKSPARGSGRHYQTRSGQTLVAGQPDGAGMMELIAAGSVWTYLDDGSDQGTAWRAREFRRSVRGVRGRRNWVMATADEATLVDCGPAPGNECGPGNPATNTLRRIFAASSQWPTRRTFRPSTYC